MIWKVTASSGFSIQNYQLFREKERGIFKLLARAYAGNYESVLLCLLRKNGQCLTNTCGSQVVCPLIILAIAYILLHTYILLCYLPNRCSVNSGMDHSWTGVERRRPILGNYTMHRPPADWNSQTPTLSSA